MHFGNQPYKLSKKSKNTRVLSQIHPFQNALMGIILHFDTNIIILLSSQKVNSFLY